MRQIYQLVGVPVNLGLLRPRPSIRMSLSTRKQSRATVSPGLRHGVQLSHPCLRIDVQYLVVLMPLPTSHGAVVDQARKIRTWNISPTQMRRLQPDTPLLVRRDPSNHTVLSSERLDACQVGQLDSDAPFRDIHGLNPQIYFNLNSLPSNRTCQVSTWSERAHGSLAPA